MAGIDPTDRSPTGGVRPPRQRRTQEQWTRVLDAGLTLLEEGGGAAFTIPALCQAAGVPPRALYARADSKEDLLLAVYEHGIARLEAAEASLEHSLDGRSGRDLVSALIEGLVDLFGRHGAFLRAVVLMAPENAEVARRGAARREALATRFVEALAALDHQSRHRDLHAAGQVAFGLVFSALVMHAGYGPEFSGTVDPDTLTDVVWHYLSGAPSP